MARPQTYIRGLHRVGGLSVGSTGILYRAYSTTTPLTSANSTGLIVAGGMRLGTTAVYLTRNSTGYKIGARYISTNTTGNLVT